MKGDTIIMISQRLRFSVIFFSILLLSACAVGAVDFGGNWNKLHDILTDTLTLMDEQKTLPEKSWIPFKKDQTDVREKINALMDDAVGILNISEASEIKADIGKHRRTITELHRRVSELHTRKMMAPRDVEKWKIWESDVADYEKKIEAINRRISENEAAVDRLKDTLIEKVREIGIELDPDQADTLIYGVTGDDDIEMISVFDNIKVITGKLKTLTADSGENVETARRYYGMHTVLLKTLLFLQQTYIDRVDTNYLVSLKSLESENRDLMENTRSLIRTSGGTHKKIYRTNLAAQQLTDRTITLYMRHLKSNRKRIDASKARIEKEYRIAENTYRTVSAAYALIELMQNADRFFNSLSALQIPDLLTFENREMKAEFKKLSSRLAAE